MFKGYCFPRSIILQAVFLKVIFSQSHRGVEVPLSIKGVKVAHATLQRWVFKFA
jgi:putative transposase